MGTDTIGKAVSGLKTYTTASTLVNTFKEFKASSSSEITASGFGDLNRWAKKALKDVSQQRSDLGAIQNRLEHTINNLDNVVENTTSAESAIRDTDMATEMVKYSNNNILAQAGQAMLAQANQSNQGVLSLLG
jgi:flagellin